VASIAIPWSKSMISWCPIQAACGFDMSVWHCNHLMFEKLQEVTENNWSLRPLVVPITIPATSHPFRRESPWCAENQFERITPGLVILLSEVKDQWVHQTWWNRVGKTSKLQWSEQFTYDGWSNIDTRLTINCRWSWWLHMVKASCQSREHHTERRLAK
jgi:hypothetical protein